MTTGSAPAGALGDLRVLDLTDDLGAYSSRLLRDLGADVVRVETSEDRGSCEVEPFVSGPNGLASAFDLFVNGGKSVRVLPLGPASSVRGISELLRTADIVIESTGRVLDRYGLADEDVARLAPGLVRVIVTPFGLDETRPWESHDDLLVLAAGGLLHLGGYPETGPVAAYGGQSRYAASIFAAVAAISGVLERELTGSGTTIEVSAQECIAQALEDSAATYSLTGHVRERQGDRPREAGTGVYPCADGYVSMVAGRLGTARAWTALVAWMAEEGSPGAEVLQSPEWERFEHRQTPEAIDAFARIFGEFTRTRTKLSLYEEAQARMIALSPVSTVQDLFVNPQLHSREFFALVDDPATGRPLIYPGAPYRLSATPPQPPASPARVDPVQRFAAPVSEVTS